MENNQSHAVNNAELFPNYFKWDSSLGEQDLIIRFLPFFDAESGIKTLTVEAGRQVLENLDKSVPSGIFCMAFVNDQPCYIQLTNVLQKFIKGSRNDMNDAGISHAEGMLSMNELFELSQNKALAVTTRVSQVPLTQPDQTAPKGFKLVGHVPVLRFINPKLIENKEYQFSFHHSSQMQDYINKTEKLRDEMLRFAAEWDKAFTMPVTPEEFTAKYGFCKNDRIRLLKDPEKTGEVIGFRHTYNPTTYVIIQLDGFSKKAIVDSSFLEKI